MRVRAHDLRTTPDRWRLQWRCASHMRQHVDAACYGRFATGRCGHRPLRGACFAVGAAIGRPRKQQKHRTRRCKYVPDWVLRICIGVVLSLASTADERCSPLHTHPPVVAHDSQGTSCASHMRQHVCACDTRAHFRQPAKPLTYPKTGNAHNGASRRVDERREASPLGVIDPYGIGAASVCTDHVRDTPAPSPPKACAHLAP